MRIIDNAAQRFGEGGSQERSEEGTQQHPGYWVFRMSRVLGKFVLSAPIRPARASVTYEVTLKFLVAAYTLIFAGPSDKTFTAWTRRHDTRAIPLDEDFVPICVRDHARPIRLGMSFIDVVKESAIDSGFVHEAFALIIEHDPRHHTSIDHPLFSQLLHLTGECPTIVTRVFSALG
jgi:hypothetical protein